MPLPEVIPVRYSEEEAGYVTFRPVVRQTFRFPELLDMVVSVTGKDAARVRQILRSGTVVFHFYRYWWQGFEASEEELRGALATFPDPDPSRPFRATSCAAAIFESGGGSTPVRLLLELDRKAAAHKRLLRRKSAWDALMAAAASGPLSYDAYSYARRADLYRLDLTDTARDSLRAATEGLAPRALRRELRLITGATRVLFACPRAAS
jgi:hypothetical protein